MELLVKTNYNDLLEMMNAHEAQWAETGVQADIDFFGEYNI